MSGSGSSGAPLAPAAVPSAWFASLVEHLSPAKSLEERLAMVPKLLASMRTYRYSHDNLVAVWTQLEGLRTLERGREALWTVMEAMCRCQFEQLGSLRIEFLHVIKAASSAHTMPSSSSAGATGTAASGAGSGAPTNPPPNSGNADRQRVLDALVQGGRRIDPHAPEVAALVSTWLTEASASESTSEAFAYASYADTVGLLRLVANLLKVAYFSFPPDVAASLTERVCALCDRAARAGDRTVVAACLSCFDVQVRYGSLPHAALPPVLRSMCRVVNSEALATWEIMRNLLRSPLGEQAFLILLELLQQPPESASLSVLRGAVFSISMSRWGPADQQVASLPFPNMVILSYLGQHLAARPPILITEIIVCVSRLLRKFPGELRLEWDILLNMLRDVAFLMPRDLPTTAAPAAATSTTITTSIAPAVHASSTEHINLRILEAAPDADDDVMISAHTSVFDAPLEPGAASPSHRRRTIRASPRLLEAPRDGFKTAFEPQPLPPPPASVAVSAQPPVPPAPPAQPAPPSLAPTISQPIAIPGTAAVIVPTTMPVVAVEDMPTETVAPPKAPGTADTLRFLQAVIKFFSLLQTCCAAGQFAGDEQLLVHTIELYLPILTPDVIALALSHLERNLERPGVDVSACVGHIADTYFIRQPEDQVSVRHQALQVLHRAYSSLEPAARARVEATLLRVLAKVHKDEHQRIRIEGCSIVRSMALHRTTADTPDPVLNLLHTFLEESTCSDVQQNAISAIVAVLTKCESYPAGARALQAFNMLCTLLGSHPSSEVRSLALQAMAPIECNSKYQISWSHKHAYAVFLYSSAAHTPAGGTTLPIQSLVDALVARLQSSTQETEFIGVLSVLTHCAINHCLMRDVHIASLRNWLISQLSDLQFGASVATSTVGTKTPGPPGFANSPPAPATNSGEALRTAAAAELSSLYDADPGTAVFKPAPVGQPIIVTAPQLGPQPWNLVSLFTRGYYLLGVLIDANSTSSADARSQVLRMAADALGQTIRHCRSKATTRVLSPSAAPATADMMPAAGAAGGEPDRRTPGKVRSFFRNPFAAPTSDATSDTSPKPFIRRRSAPVVVPPQIIAPVGSPSVEQITAPISSPGIGLAVGGDLVDDADVTRYKLYRFVALQPQNVHSSGLASARSLALADLAHVLTGLMAMSISVSLEPANLQLLYRSVVSHSSGLRAISDPSPDPMQWHLQLPMLQLLFDLVQLSDEISDMPATTLQDIAHFCVPFITSHSVGPYRALLAYRVLAQLYLAVPWQQRGKVADTVLSALRSHVNSCPCDMVSSLLQLILKFRIAAPKLVPLVSWPPARPDCFATLLRPQPGARAVRCSWASPTSVISIAVGLYGFAEITTRSSCGLLRWYTQIAVPPPNGWGILPSPAAIAGGDETGVEAASSTRRRELKIAAPPAVPPSVFVPPSPVVAGTKDHSNSVDPDEELLAATSSSATMTIGSWPLAQGELTRLLSSDMSLRRDAARDPVPSVESTEETSAAAPNTTASGVSSASTSVVTTTVLPTLVHTGSAVSVLSVAASVVSESDSTPAVTDSPATADTAVVVGTTAPAPSPQRTRGASAYCDENDTDLDATPGLPFHPSFLLQHVAGTIENPDHLNLLQSGNALARALSVLDRTPAVETHKIGVVYVAPGQTTEEAVLGNDMGSPRYISFLNALGSFVRLQDYDGYAGGLDTRAGADGEFAVMWRGVFTHVVYHVATLMRAPGHMAIAKKRHIGNDFVTIVYLEDGAVFKLDTLPGQFNFVHILVQPCDEFNYRVTVSKKGEVPPFGGIFGTHIVPEHAVGRVVRLCAMQGDLVCRALLEGKVEPLSNQAERSRLLRQVCKHLIAVASV